MAKNKDVTTSNLSRRTVVKGAAWSVPVIAVAAAAPAAAASEATVVDNFSISGSCGGLGLLGAGFDVTASATTPLPAGTIITITRGGTLSIGLLNLALGGGLSSVADLTLLEGSNSYQVTLNSDFSGTGSIDTVITVNVGGDLTGTITLPSGYTAGAGAKTTGSLESTLFLCNAA